MVLFFSPARQSSGLAPWAGLSAALALNWWLAAAVQSSVFSVTSLALLIWLLALVGRASAAGLILLLPFIITRGATLLSLMAIEQGAFMPEIDQIGIPGSASASFVTFTALFFGIFTLAFTAFEPWFLAFARSPLLDRMVALLGWPVLAAAAGLAALALLHGLHDGFPLLMGIDRFLYRRSFGGPLVLFLLDNKFLIALLLGSVAFSPTGSVPRRLAARLLFCLLTATYFLFGDKFFTILVQTSFFLMPMLLVAPHRLGAMLLRIAPLALVLLCLSSSATLYIYSGYGRLPLDRTLKHVGERVADQGQLWFVATRDAGSLTHWDSYLVNRNLAVLDDASPPASAFAARIETYYFIERYAPAALAANFAKNQGWVQLAMGTEAMALVMFGYLGVAAVMVALGLLVAMAGLYVRRTIVSAFPLSQLFAVWTYLQVYFAAQQASLWPVAAPGQINRLLLFVTLEVLLLAVNRGQFLLTKRSRLALGQAA